MKIVVGTSPGEDAVAAWRDEFPDVTFVEAPGVAEQVAAIADADAYIGRIPREVFLAAGPGLRWVHSTGAGVETVVSTPELVDSDIILTNTRGAHASCIAEHAFGMLLTLTRGLQGHAADQHGHTWRRPITGRRELTGATMVVVGVGNIGRAIAKRAVAFELRVIGVDLEAVEPPAGVEAIWGLDRLDEALRQADVVAVATPLTRRTRGLLDARRIGLIKPDAYLLVLSRGGIIDEAALVAALRAGRLAGAGLDVQATEPLPPDSPLWDAPNLILTPHCSATSRQTRERVMAISTENVRRFVAGQELTNVCDKEAGF
ncbi:MAG TPA: D-2-hydroxyacid dehydrogenase [Thermomicrobiales bacterium]|nr:D-2-hydroxyacid dehydrogenase [Thermomicrobiales bacterium]